MNELLQLLESQFRKISSLVDDNGEIKKWVAINRVRKFDVEIIELLLEVDEIKETFFKNINDVLVFDQNALIYYLEQNQHLGDSYTQFKKKVGLQIDGKYVKQHNLVNLVWPYKDCTLKGGQSSEGEKFQEPFLNEIISHEAISQLREPKVLTNAKVHDKTGVKDLVDFERDNKLNDARNLCEDTITDNIIIKGNNLLALYSLRKQFKNKIKIIYIDPPYNTGKDSFGYNDKFNHSTWLTFMKNRFEIAKELLSDDGVIFVSLDDNEVHYCKVLMDEIFKRKNFIANICHKSRASVSNDKIISGSHNHILMYAKNERLIFSQKQKFGLNKTEDDLSDESFPGKDEGSGKRYKLVPVDGPGGSSKGNPHFTFKGVTQYWRFSIDTMNRMWEEGKLVKSSSGGIQQKLYREDVENNRKTITTWWDEDEFGNNFLTQSATASLKQLVGEDVLESSGFKNPKNVNLLKYIVKLWAFEGDIVLDYFAGSATTAHAVLDQNKEDGVNRKFILVEQMNYFDSLTCNRISKVIEQNQQGSFVSLELKKWNQHLIESIEKATDKKTLLEIYEKMKQKDAIKFNVDIPVFEAENESFSQLDLPAQKLFMIDILDKNQLYVNTSSIDDSDFALSDLEKKWTRDFYQSK